MLPLPKGLMTLTEREGMALADTPLRVQFTVTEEDVYRLQVYHLLHTRELQCALLLGAILLFAGTGYLLRVLGERPVTAWVGGFLAVLLFAGLNWWGASRRATQWSQRTGAANKQQSVELSPQGLLWGVESEQTSIQWAEIQRVSGIPGYVCIFLSKKSANAIPRRAFATLEESEAFLKTARQWHAAAVAEGSGEPRNTNT
jgi:hypothetical protein